MELLQELVDLSRHYGAGTDWVIGGGGNTSVKSADHMWVKASGTTLAAIGPEQFVQMERSKLDAIWRKRYPQDSARREAQALQDLLDARSQPQATTRPSVETLMHALFPQRLVVHTHPTLINGLTCARDGEQACAELFGDRAVWIPTIEPGYTLANQIAALVARWREHHDGAWPQILIMQNHGITVAADSTAEIHDLHRTLVEAVGSRVDRKPDVADREPSALLTDHQTTVAAAVAAVTGVAADALQVVAFHNAELAQRSATIAAFAAVDSAFTPDHIVYSGYRPCYVAAPTSEAEWPQAIHTAVSDYHAAAGAAPKIVVLQGHGALAIATNERKVGLAQLLFIDSLKIAGYSQAFGGPQFMPADQIDFIRGWEVEAFRERQSTGG